MYDYQVVLALEMIVLIAGETGIAMVHGWTEGIGYSMKGYYTPLWTCAVLMVLLFLLIISLFFVFIGLHFNYPGIIQHHSFALAFSFPVALCVVIAGIATGGPFLVAFLVVLYFGALLPFAYIYASHEWTTTDIKDLEGQA
ncbi:unnamed protein product [Bursaphelenchus xylophilus]|uniref:(pine wood nematode) hypothetical protein n=1 Tax=Bursaphelenchus xylophilus TaxID=6326 RepID=A0A1I7RQ84_BURXY|nr:unnamed protein product [Bursaphelenchus xylophilus]CAG9097306.1 unnamed protein product [Bursaphelenchus xylophilus]